MRKEYENYKNVLKDLIRKDLHRRKEELHLTHEEMAELLLMDQRSFIDLDHGKSMAGTMTFLIYLCSVCDDPIRLLREVARSLAGLEHREIHISAPFVTLIESGEIRLPKPVTKSIVLRCGSIYPVCPFCNAAVEREYQKHCSRCGQALEWSSYPETEAEHAL